LMSLIWQRCWRGRLDDLHADVEKTANMADTVADINDMVAEVVGTDDMAVDVASLADIALIRR